MSSVPVEFETPPDRPLVSATSILLFSAFLAGIAFGQMLPPASQFHAVAAAGAGTLAYIGLWYTTLVKEQLKLFKAKEKVSRKLERKLGKHLSCRSDHAAGVSRRVDQS